MKGSSNSTTHLTSSSFLSETVIYMFNYLGINGHYPNVTETVKIYLFS